MKPCPEYQEILWLDVYGELDAHRRREWERHLASCPACRRERVRGMHLIHNVREAVPVPVLSPSESRIMTRSVMQALEQPTGMAGWLARLRVRPVRLVPSLVTACLVVAVLGWFGFQEFPALFPPQTISKADTDEHLLLKDFEVIRNLELLEEMEAVEKLVQVVDQREYGRLSSKKYILVMKEPCRNDANV